jgi:hypothetical protein
MVAGQEYPLEYKTIHFAGSKVVDTFDSAPYHIALALVIYFHISHDVSNISADPGRRKGERARE